MMLTTRVQALRLNIRAVTWTKKKTQTPRTDINAFTLTATFDKLENHSKYDQNLVATGHVSESLRV